MVESFIVQGRCLSEPDLELIRGWRRAQPGWSRWRLSRELAAHWDWRNGAGQFKDMAARTLLVKLAQRGLIELPARRQVPTNRMRTTGKYYQSLRVQKTPVRAVVESNFDLHDRPFPPADGVALQGQGGCILCRAAKPGMLGG